MGLLKAAVFGLVGGAIGAGIWAAIAYVAHYELAFIAWLVGGLVGMGVRLGAGDEDGWTPGVLAGALAAAAVLAGKYAAVAILAHQITAGFSAQIGGESEKPEEFAVSYIADDVVRERDRAGQPIRWPAGVEADEAYAQADYPPDIWAEAERRWAATPPCYRDSALTTPAIASVEQRTAMMAHLVVEQSPGGYSAFTWPDNDVPDEHALFREEFPADLWTSAESRLAHMTDEEHPPFAAWAAHRMQSQHSEGLEALGQTLVQHGFASSFTPWDFLWLFLAVGTAFKLGSGLVSSDD